MVFTDHGIEDEEMAAVGSGPEDFGFNGHAPPNLPTYIEAAAVQQPAPAVPQRPHQRNNPEDLNDLLLFSQLELHRLIRESTRMRREANVLKNRIIHLLRILAKENQVVE